MEASTWTSVDTLKTNCVCTVYVQYIPRNMHAVFALLCFVVVIHWLIFPYPSGLLHWHCGNLTIAPVPAKQPWWIWINTSCEFIMNDCITTTKQSTTKPCAYFLGYTVQEGSSLTPFQDTCQRTGFMILLAICNIFQTILIHNKMFLPEHYHDIRTIYSTKVYLPMAMGMLQTLIHTHFILSIIIIHHNTTNEYFWT